MDFIISLCRTKSYAKGVDMENLEAPAANRGNQNKISSRYYTKELEFEQLCNAGGLACDC